MLSEVKSYAGFRFWRGFALADVPGQDDVPFSIGLALKSCRASYEIQIPLQLFLEIYGSSPGSGFFSAPSFERDPWWHSGSR
jgi:hypothetical protein